MSLLLCVLCRRRSCSPTSGIMEMAVTKLEEEMVSLHFQLI
jgi:hypothetical protein